MILAFAVAYLLCYISYDSKTQSKGTNMLLDENTVLCASSAYEKKYYLNDNFSNLPEQIKQELQIMCVLFTEEVGGILMLQYNEDGTLELVTQCDEGDILYDEIGSALKIKEIQRTKAELLEALEMYYKVFVLGEDM